MLMASSTSLRLLAIECFKKRTLVGRLCLAERGDLRFEYTGRGLANVRPRSVEVFGQRVTCCLHCVAAKVATELVVAALLLSLAPPFVSTRLPSRFWRPPSRSSRAHDGQHVL